MWSLSEEDVSVCPTVGVDMPLLAVLVFQNPPFFPLPQGFSHVHQIPAFFLNPRLLKKSRFSFLSRFPSVMSIKLIVANPC